MVPNIEILKNVGIQTTLEPIDFNYMRFLKISYFMLDRRKKVIEFCNNMRVSKWWRIFYFWANSYFKFYKHLIVTVYLCTSVIRTRVFTLYTIVLSFYLFTEHRKKKCVCIFSPCQSPGSFWHFLGQICPSKVWGDAGKFLIEEWILALYRYIPFHPHLQRNPETHTTFQSQFVCDTVCIHFWHY